MKQSATLAFIEVTQTDGHKSLLNLARIQQITNDPSSFEWMGVPEGTKTVIIGSFGVSRLAVRESYEMVLALVKQALQEGFASL